jgi:hypothetical protein
MRKQLADVPDRRQWIAQLMREHRQEFVLAPICIPQSLLALPQRSLCLPALDEVGCLSSQNIEQAQVAVRRLVGLPPVRGDHSHDLAVAR